MTLKNPNFKAIIIFFFPISLILGSALVNLTLVVGSLFLIYQSYKEKIDFLKIDTEGSEYDIIKGATKNIKKIKLILFEHHFDDMISKEYKFSDINNLLIQNNFKQIFKIRMPFRKTFEYIYLNKTY